MVSNPTVQLQIVVGRSRVPTEQLEIEEAGDAMTTEPTTQSEPTALPAAMPSAPQPPPIHIRALIAWVAIFPLVALGMLALGPVFDPLHPVLRALILTLIVVPVAVYLVVPPLMAAYGRMAARRRR